MSQVEEVLLLLRSICGDYAMAPRAVFQAGLRPSWPLVAESEEGLEHELSRRGHFVPLPKEPAALANVIEVSIVDYLFTRLENEPDIHLMRGTERGYPDVELSGARFGEQAYAIDVKVARRASNGKQTQSRITLYTGNTYFRYPQLRWSGTFRPFEQYAAHLDLIVLYTFAEGELSRITDLEILAHESWQIASKQRSSTTREYIGAVTSIDALRAGQGEFQSLDEFYLFWKKFNFKIGRAVQQQLDKLLRHVRKGE
ncbi:MAG: type II restriction endonuclease [Acidobacteriota bacterium]